MNDAVTYFSVCSDSDKNQKFYNAETWAQCYKTFYDRNLQIILIS